MLSGALLQQNDLIPAVGMKSWTLSSYNHRNAHSCNFQLLKKKLKHLFLDVTANICQYLTMVNYSIPMQNLIRIDVNLTLYTL